MEKICTNPRSIGYYIENTLGIELKDIWDYKKNTEGPDEIYKTTKKKTIWVKCMHHDYHGSYEITPFRFSNNPSSSIRCCPLCARRGTNKEVHIKDSFATKFEKYLDWWSKDNEKTPYDYRGNEWDKIKFTCPICGWSFKQVLRDLQPNHFNHRCKNNEPKGTGYDRFEEYKKEQRKQQFQCKLDSIYGRGTWTIKEFESTSEPGILIHSCGHEKYLSKMRIAYNGNMLCEICK